MSDPLNATSVVARIVTDAGRANRLSDALMEMFDPFDAAVSTFEVAGAGPPLWAVEIYFEGPPDEKAVRAVLSDIAGKDADGAAFTTVAARDWVAESLKGLTPVEAGRFTVHGAHDRARVPENRIGIEIEAALAFGTGHHGTTRGCLLALDRVLCRRRPRSVLDIGTGTGVLAIAAALAGRAQVRAGDVDAVSVRVARENVRANRAAALVRVMRADGVRDRQVRAGAPYDLVFANILLGPVRRLATPVRRLTAAGGTVVLSGLLSAQAGAALGAWRSRGFVLERRFAIEGWTTLVMVRPKRGLNR